MNVLICDNSPQRAEYCKKQIALIAAENELYVNVQVVESPASLLFFLDTKFAKTDLIYLEYDFPKMTGMQAAKEIRKSEMPVDIVFYANDDSHIIEAFDVQPLSFIVINQTSKQKFEEVFLKAVERSQKKHIDILTCSYANEYRNIPIADIVYFEVRKRIITVHYLSDNEYLTFDFYSTMAKIVEALEGYGFVRIHSSFLVSQRFITTKNSREIKLFNGQVLPVGKSFRANIKLFNQALL